MYRYSRRGRSYYNCRGLGPNRAQCGAHGIPTDILDKVIEETMAADNRPRVVRVPVAGDDNDEQREIISQKISAAAAEGNFALIAELTEQAMQIGPSRRASRIEDRDSGKTIGQHWQTLSRAQKRDELANWQIIARMNDGVPEVRMTWRSPWETATPEQLAEQDA